MPETEFGFKLVGIAAELEQHRLGVPIYQRSYAWGDDEDDGSRDHVRELWTDLSGTFQTNDAEYFLGTVVLSREGLTSRTA